MGHKHGESREQVTLFPTMLDELVAADALVRVIDAWVESLDMQDLGFQKAQAKGMGRPTLRASGFTQAIPVWLPQRHTLLQSPGARMQAQCRSHVVAGPPGTRS